MDRLTYNGLVVGCSPKMGDGGVGQTWVWILHPE